MGGPRDSSSASPSALCSQRGLRAGAAGPRLPAAGSDGCAGADRPAGMLSPREALAGGCAFLGIVLGIVRAASVRRADEIRARRSALGQRSRCRAADGAISGTRALSVLPSLRGAEGTAQPP